MRNSGEKERIKRLLYEVAMTLLEDPSWPDKPMSPDEIRARMAAKRAAMAESDQPKQ